jgi:TolB-like protein/Flp pilus assembly protein TadD
MRGFIKELRRRRVFRTAAYYIVGAWLVMQVADVLFPGWGLPDAAVNVLFIAAVIGFPLALVFGWFFDVTTHGIVRTPGPDDEERESPLALQRRDYLVLAALALIGVAILTEATREVVEMPRVTTMAASTLEFSVIEEKLPYSIAVLPFDSIGDGPADEYLGIGISEEIMNQLVRFSGLNVIGRNSSFQFKDSEYPLQRISDLLGARFLLQGSISQEEDRLRISAQLVDETGTLRWSNTFDRATGDIFAIQAEIAEVVAATIAPQIAGPSATPYEPSLEAYQYFLEGRELLRSRIDVKGRARDRLRKAIELDPEYAAAYVELAITELFYTITEEEIAAANELIDHALSLEPGMPRALAVRAFSLQRQDDPDWAVSEIVLRDVLAREPNNVDALDWLNRALTAQGKFAEAATVLDRAARLDPLHGSVAVAAATESVSRGDFETAERRLLRLLEAPNPGFNTHVALRDFFWHTGRLVDMNAISKRQALTIGRHYVGLSWSYALLGLWEQASYWAERSMVDMPNWFWGKFFGRTGVPTWQGRYRDALGEWDKALVKAGKTLSELPDIVAVFYGDAQALAGDFDGAVRTLEPILGGSRPVNLAELGDFSRDAMHSLAFSYLQAGMPDKSRRILEGLEDHIAELQRQGRLHKSNDLFFFARNALLMGDRDLALSRLEQAIAVGWRDYYITMPDPRWSGLRDDAGFQALMAGVKADVDEQRADVLRMDADEDFPAKLDAARALRE